MLPTVSRLLLIVRYAICRDVHSLLIHRAYVTPVFPALYSVLSLSVDVYASPTPFLAPERNRACQTGIFAGYWATDLRQRGPHSVPGCRTGCCTVCSPQRYGAVSVGLREYHCPKGIERREGRSWLL